jgi:hypothetical protein
VKVQDDEVTFTLDISGSSPIERIELRDGLETLDVIRPYSERELGARIRVVWEGAEYRGRGRMVSWDGHLHLHGNRIRQAKPINFWNADNQLESRGDTGLAWKAVTTGSFGGADIWLDDATAGRIEIETPQGRFEALIEDIGFDDMSFECGGLGKRLRLFRLPERMTAKTMRWSRTLSVNSPGEGDTRPYVCVTREDGHQAWSSPVYLFR